jgi:hypothetical protein
VLICHVNAAAFPSPSARPKASRHGTWPRYEGVEAFLFQWMLYFLAAKKPLRVRHCSPGRTWRPLF